MTAAAMHKQEIEVISRLSTERDESAYAPFDSIIDRKEDTRTLNPLHVEDLFESIDVLGLLEPLVVDLRIRLLAGGHRKAAIALLRNSKPLSYEKHFPNDMVPIRIMPFDSEEEPERALQCEIAENEKRRDYTSSEIKDIAEKLKSAGFIALKGRPKKGQKALMPALSVVVGKSIRRIQQYFEVSNSSPETKAEKSTKLFALLKSAKRAIKNSHEIASEIPRTKELQKSLEDILLQVDEVLESLDGKI
jgi:ParB family chromosome partitioning protein